MQELINKADTFLVDVRTAAEVAEVAVPGAINIPLDTLPDNLSRFQEASGAVIVFCRSGVRSESAMNWLLQNGVKEVYNAGGYPSVLAIKN